MILDFLLYKVTPPAYHLLAPDTDKSAAERIPPVVVSAMATVTGLDGSSGRRAFASRMDSSARMGRREDGGNSESVIVLRRR